MADRFPEKLFFYADNVERRWALSTVADYRVELALALQRWEHQSGYDPEIFTHSLIDNLAYVTYAVSRYSEGTVSLGTTERAILTMTVLGTILRDSFKYDHIFFLRGHFDPNEDYDKYQLQSVLQMVLDEYQMTYEIIDANSSAEDTIADVLEGYLVDKG